jgi:hypothetical protein
MKREQIDAHLQGYATWANASDEAKDAFYKGFGEHKSSGAGRRVVQEWLVFYDGWKSALLAHGLSE